MKKIAIFKMSMLSYVLAVALTATLFSACSSSPDELPSGTIEDLVEELLEESGQEQSFVKINVGTYELNSPSDRVKLMKLQAAGVINYKVERYAWWNKTLSIVNIRKWYASVGEQTEKIGNTYYDFEQHFVVTVSLTDEAKSYLVDSIPQPQPKEDKDMKQPDIDYDSFPESKVKLEESWPKIPNPENPETPKLKEPETITIDLSEPVAEEKPKKPTWIEESVENDYDAPVRMSLDIATSTAYEEIKQKFNEEEVILKSAKMEVEKARFIQIFDDVATGKRCGIAEIIIEMSDVTAAGRVIEGKYDGIRFCSPVNLVYYYDKGWILQDKTLDLQPYSNLGIEMSASGTITGGESPEVKPEDTEVLDTEEYSW